MFDAKMTRSASSAMLCRDFHLADELLHLRDGLLTYLFILATDQ